MTYQNDIYWRKIQGYLPEKNRISDTTSPNEYFIDIDKFRIHIDHYSHKNPKDTIILFHGVGGNGRLLSFIAHPLHSAGYEVICPDMPLYGFTEYDGLVSYRDWVKCGVKITEHYQQKKETGIFLFGLSAGGMLAYQVACECSSIKGLIATCLLDQRIPYITKQTAINPVMGTLGKKLMEIFHKPLAKIKLPMKMVSDMKNIVNNKELVEILTSDKKSCGIKVPVEFIYKMLNPEINTEPEHFNNCPFLLVHPEKDRWTDISLSLMFFDKLKCPKQLKMLNGAGHFPIEPEGLLQLESYCLDFLCLNS